MARNKANQVNIDNSDLVNYPNGRIRNNDGSGNGTPVNEEVYGDYHEFFAKLLRSANINYNNLPENEQNGYQYVEALKRLTTKNDLVYQITQDVSGLVVNFDLNLLQIGEFLICKSSIDFSNQTVIKGGTVTRPLLNIFNFKKNDYLILRKNSADIELLNLTPFLPVNNIEEEAGGENKKFTTPESNNFIFTKKVTGALSVNYLAQPYQSVALPGRNGLMSAQDKKKLNDLTGPNNRGYFTLGDITGGQPVGSSLPISGDCISAIVAPYIDAGNHYIDVTIPNPMPSNNYFVRLFVESVGNISTDNDAGNPVFKVVDTTKFRVGLYEAASTAQSIRFHFETIAY